MTASAVAGAAEARAERDELQAGVGRFLERAHPLSSVRDLTGAESLDRDGWRRLATEVDLPGVRIAPEHGGLGLSFAYVALVAEELGRRLVPTPHLTSVGMAGVLLSRLASIEQQERWLPRLVDGGLVATATISWGPATVAARLVGEDVVLDGEASRVLDGGDADLVLVPVELEGRLRVAVVESDAVGLRRTPLTTVDRTRHQAHLSFNECRAELLGSISVDAAKVVARVRTEATALLAVEALGAMESCLSGVIDYVRDRRQFGAPVGAFQAVQHELADLHGELQSARAAVGHAVDLLDRTETSHEREEVEMAVAVAALRASEAQERVARQGLHLHGGIGFTWEHTSHLFLKRALSDRSLLAERRHHRALVARTLFAR